MHIGLYISFAFRSYPTVVPFFQQIEIQLTYISFRYYCAFYFKEKEEIFSVSVTEGTQGEEDVLRARVSAWHSPVSLSPAHIPGVTLPHCLVTKQLAD